MVFVVKKLIPALLLWGVLGIGSVLAADPVEMVVIAKVGDIPITVFELQREMYRILPMFSSFHSGISEEKEQEVQKQALETLIDQAHKVRFSFKNEISVSKADLDQRMKQVKGKFADQSKMKKAMGKETVEDLRSSIYRMMLAQKAEDVAVNNKVNYTDVEIEGFYKKNPSMYQLPRQYRASHILIKIDPSLVGEERERLIAKANDIAEKAKSGEGFFDLAYFNSDDDSKFVGGDIGYFYSGKIVKEFEAAIRDLSPGEIVGPVETISGLDIIKLTDVKAARAMTLDEVRDNIQKTIVDKNRNNLYQEWIKGLREQVIPEVYHPELQGLI